MFGHDITPNVLLMAYANGAFPMARSREDKEIIWLCPELRGIIPLGGFHISRSLGRAIRKTNYDIKIDTDFTGTVTACAARKDTWISGKIFNLYKQIHHMGYAHSLEVWDKKEMIGGIYGVALGGAFFGESMFSRKRNTSKIALAWLIHGLRSTGYSLFDTQFLTPHLASLGGIEVHRDEYMQQLKTALKNTAHFDNLTRYQPNRAEVAAGIIHPHKHMK